MDDIEMVRRQPEQIAAASKAIETMRQEAAERARALATVAGQPMHVPQRPAVRSICGAIIHF